MSLAQNPDKKTLTEREKRAEAVRIETERALSLELSKDDAEKEPHKGEVVFDEFADSYAEAFATEQAVQNAELTKRTEKDVKTEKSSLAKIAGLSLKEVIEQQNHPDINISQKDLVRMKAVITELANLDETKKREKLSKMEILQKNLLLRALRWQALEARKNELLYQEWFSDIERITAPTEEIPVETVEVPVEKKNQAIG